MSVCGVEVYHPPFICPSYLPTYRDDDHGGLIRIRARRVVARIRRVTAMVYMPEIRYVRPALEMETQEDLCRRRGRRTRRFAVCIHFTTRYCARKSKSGNIILDVYICDYVTYYELTVEYLRALRRHVRRYRKPPRRPLRFLRNVVVTYVERKIKDLARALQNYLDRYFPGICAIENIYIAINTGIGIKPIKTVCGEYCRCKYGEYAKIECRIVPGCTWTHA